MAGESRTAIVVGASTGIGAACVRELARRGFHVAALSRDGARLEDLAREVREEGRGEVHTWTHDVRDTAAIPDLFTSVVAELGGLDMIIYNAGVMPRIDEDTFDWDKDRLVLEVNLLGCVAWLDQAAPFFKRQGHGSIVGISSIAGDRGRRGYPAYNASKAGMDTFLEALLNRLHREGVRVTTIKPGFIDTAMTKGLEGLFWLYPPQKAARDIVAAALRGRRRRYVPRRWALVALVIRNIPSFLFRRIDI